jgi:hypothetical protein
MTCPSCEYNKQRAAIWRAEAYKQAGHDVIQRPWVGLTLEEILDTYRGPDGSDYVEYARALDAILKEKNT